MTADYYAGLDLPASVLARVKSRPIEDLILKVLERGLPDVPSYSLIPKNTPPMFVLVRKVPEMGLFAGRRPFFDECDFAIHVYVEDPDGDEKGALLSDAVCDVMAEAYRDHWGFPGLGSVTSIKCTQAPVRETDWATSSGPVQYADLPTGDWRYEARFRARVRLPSQPPA